MTRAKTPSDRARAYILEHGGERHFRHGVGIARGLQVTRTILSLLLLTSCTGSAGSATLTLAEVFPDQVQAAERLWPGCKPGDYSLVPTQAVGWLCKSPNCSACVYLKQGVVYMRDPSPALAAHEIGHICEYQAGLETDWRHARGTWSPGGFVTQVERGW